MIRVFPSDEKAFLTNGIKILQPTKALIRKEDNGDYYVDITDTVESMEYYQSGNLLLIDTPWGPQAFRLTDPKKTASKITLRARHVYFDSANYIIDDSYVVDKTANDAIDHLNTATDNPSPFATISDVPSVASFRCVRKTLEEAMATIVDRWGGHLVRDNFNIELRSTIGQNRGVTIQYAKNLQEITSKEDWSDVATKILPVGKDGLEVPETYMTNAPEDYEIPYTKVIKFEQANIDPEDFKLEDGEPDVVNYNAALLADLYAKATQYLNDNHVPRVNYTLKAYLKDVSDVGDYIYVKHPKIRVELTTNVIAIQYDAIAQRITGIEFGNFKSGLGQLVQNVTDTAAKAAAVVTEQSEIKLHDELAAATGLIRGTMSDSYVIYDGDKILIVDQLPKEAAQNVIMINNGGIGFGSAGINGAFSSAWTIDNQLNMENINVINLVADMIKGGTLKLGQNLNERGIIEIYGPDNSLAGTMDNTGLTMYTKTNESVRLNPIDGLAGYDANGDKIYWADGLEFHQRKSVVEEEITIGNRLRIIPISTGDNVGIGFVTLVGGI